MFKKCICALLLLITSHSHAMNNEFFSLEQEAYSLALKISQSKRKDIITKQLALCAQQKTEQSLMQLPDAVINLVNENYKWKKIGTLNLEQGEISVLITKDYLEYTLNHTNKDNIKIKKRNELSKNTRKQLRTEAMNETIALLRQILDTMM